MEKPLYKVGDIISYDEVNGTYEVMKVRESGYDLKPLFKYASQDIFTDHGFQYVHGKVRKLTKLEKALK